jgi:hypothetical protein
MKRCHSLLGAHTQGPGYDGVLLDSLPSPDPRTSTPARQRVEPGRTPRSNASIVGAHAVEFSKTAEPPLRGIPADRPARACV